jgi:CHAT domain-containing protein
MKYHSLILFSTLALLPLHSQFSTPNSELHLSEGEASPTPTRSVSIGETPNSELRLSEGQASLTRSVSRGETPNSELRTPNSELLSQVPSLGQANVDALLTQIQQAEQQGDIKKAFELRRSLVEVYKNTGNFGRANATYKENLEFIAAHQQQLGMAALLTLINNYRIQGKPDQAVTVLQAYLARSEADRIQVEGNEYEAQRGVYNARTFLAESYKDLGNFDQAIALHQQNLTFAQSDANLLANSLSLLAGVYSWQGEYGKAVELERQVLATYQKQAFAGLGIAKALEDLGMNLFLAGQKAEAETTLKSSIQAYEGQNMGFFGFEPLVDVHRWLEEVLIANQKPEEALEISEGGRARLLGSVLGQRLGVAPAAIALPRLAEIKQIAQSHQATIVEYSIIYKYRANQGYRIMWGYDLLEAQTILIWVIQPNGDIAFRQIDPATIFPSELATVVERVRANTQLGRGVNLSQSLGSTQTELGVQSRSPESEPETPTSNPQQRRKNPHLQKLHQLLIDPIADLLPSDPNDRVIFIPQDSLFSVPFPALQDANGKYLVEQHTMLTAPSIQILGLTAQAKQKLQGSAKSALVVGNPEPMPSYGFPPKPLNPLPGAGQEAVAIANLLNTQPLLGSQATKSAVVQQMTQARLIHLATHGILNGAAIDTTQQAGTQYRQDLGLDGSIALAPSGGDSGFLTAREIRDIPFKAELVVLSACDTGRGAIRGNGIVGLSSAFLQAGVPSVVVSLWEVPDEATSLLMQSFYRSFQANPDKAAALRAAMLQTLDQYPNPSDWAAFTLIGEP